MASRHRTAESTSPAGGITGAHRAQHGTSGTGTARRGPAAGAGSTHQTGLTNALLSLFQAREQLEQLPQPKQPRKPGQTGVASIVQSLPPPPASLPPASEQELTPRERREYFQKLRRERAEVELQHALSHWAPWEDDKTTEDPYRTLFVARLSYGTTEAMLRREFEEFGPLKSIRLVTDSETDRPKGYAFLEYEHTQHMKEAYKRSDGRVIDGCRVKVDVERGRTVKGFKPMRLGGGLGGESRKPAPPQQDASTSAPNASSNKKAAPGIGKSKAHSGGGRSGGKPPPAPPSTNAPAKSKQQQEDNKRGERHSRDRDGERERSSRRGDREKERERDREDRRSRKRSRSRSRDRRRR